MTRVGRSDLDIFPLVLGGNTFGWTSDEAGSWAVLDAFVEQGGNAIDSADGYSSWAPGNSGGESETIIGSWMAERGNRDQVVIGTKVSRHPDFLGLAPDTIRAGADASLKRLQTDYIDLYFAHRDDPTVPLVDTVAAFEELRATGKIRNVAVSNYSGERISEWISIARSNGWPLPVAVQPHYNLVHRQPFESEIAPILHADGLVATPYFALASGFLTGKYRVPADVEAATRADMVGPFFSDDGLVVVDALARVAQEHDSAIATVALAWLTSRPGVVAPIASARTPDQLPDLMRSADLRLTADDIAALDEASAPFAA
ncbi:MAG TPA: aldo/keto reductase [Pseudolysinimonas sp.]|jgi:aryl-alcohol dehydrogenase-like predicted oxidoreductase